MTSTKTWIPVDVKVHWFGFLGAKDLANCQRVCRSWVSLVQKTAEAGTTALIAAEPPPLSRAGKLKFLHRLQNATEKENMGYLLSWAAGSRGASGEGREREARAGVDGGENGSSPPCRPPAHARLTSPTSTLPLPLPLQSTPPSCTSSCSSAT
jgi:hypothetical protein